MSEFAFLFYINDWAGGTQWMKRLQRGAYLDLLLYQVNNTSFTLEEAKEILGEDFDSCWCILERKFILENGKYYNLKMRKVLEGRKQFTDSRRLNRLGKTKKDKKNTRKTLVKLVGNEKEKEIEDIKEEIIKHNLQIFIEKYCPNISKLKTQLTFKDCETLEKRSTPDKLHKILRNMENKSDLNKYNSVYLTIIDWLER